MLFYLQAVRWWNGVTVQIQVLISILMLNHYCRHVVGEVSAVEMIEHTAIVALYLAGGVP